MKISVYSSYSTFEKVFAVLAILVTPLTFLFLYGWHDIISIMLIIGSPHIITAGICVWMRIRPLLLGVLQIILTLELASIEFLDFDYGFFFHYIFLSPFICIVNLIVLSLMKNDMEIKAPKRAIWILIGLNAIIFLIFFLPHIHDSGHI